MSEQLKAKAKEYFEQYPKEEIIYVTSDGQVFLSANRHDASNHQRALKEGELTPVRRHDVDENATFGKLSDEEEEELSELERLRLESEEEEKVKASEEEARIKSEEEDKAAEKEARLKAEEEEKAKKNKGTKNK